MTYTFRSAPWWCDCGDPKKKRRPVPINGFATVSVYPTREIMMARRRAMEALLRPYELPLPDYDAQGLA